MHATNCARDAGAASAYRAVMPFAFEAALPWLDIAGLTVFAASGALAAAR